MSQKEKNWRGTGAFKVLNGLEQTTKRKNADRLTSWLNKFKRLHQPRRSEVARLQAEFEQVEAEAAEYVKQNELGQIVGWGRWLNANTSTEATRYFYSFPANKLELWMSLGRNGFWSRCFESSTKERCDSGGAAAAVDNSHWSDGRDVVGYGLQGASIQASCD